MLVVSQLQCKGIVVLENDKAYNTKNQISACFFDLCQEEGQI